MCDVMLYSCITKGYCFRFKNFGKGGEAATCLKLFVKNMVDMFYTYTQTIFIKVI